MGWLEQQDMKNQAEGVYLGMPGFYDKLGYVEDPSKQFYITQEAAKNWGGQSYNPTTKSYSPIDDYVAPTPAPTPTAPKAQAMAAPTATPQVDLNGLYQQYFGRNADAGGAAYWQDQLSKGMSLGELNNQFASAAKQYASGTGNFDTSITSQGWTPSQVASKLGNTNSTLKPTTTVSNPAASPTAGTYKGLTWDQIVNPAKSDYQLRMNGGGFDSNGVYRNYGTADSFDQFSGGTTTIGGNAAQIYRPGGKDDDWNNAVFNFKDPNGPEGYMTRLTRNADGTVKTSYYKEENGIPTGLVAVLAAPFIAGLGSELLSLGGAEGTAAGAGAGAEWVSGYDLAGGAALPTGASTAPGWVSGYDLADGGALGVGETAPGWVSAEGGAGYAGGQAADVVSGTTPVTGGGWTSAEGGSGYSGGAPVDAPAGTTVPGGGTYVPPVTPTTIRPPIPTGTAGGGSGGGNSNGMNLGTLLSLLYDTYSKNNMSNQLKGYLDQINSMYKPGSPEAELMRQKIEARDAMNGRRSQYGRRETELAGMLADSRMRALTSPGFMTMQAAMMNNAPSMGGLASLFGALGANNGVIPGLNISLSDIANTGLLDGDGWLSNLFN